MTDANWYEEEFLAKYPRAKRAVGFHKSDPFFPQKLALACSDGYSAKQFVSALNTSYDRAVGLFGYDPFPGIRTEQDDPDFLRFAADELEAFRSGRL